jgi:hypothetical protein
MDNIAEIDGPARIYLRHGQWRALGEGNDHARFSIYLICSA